jgi:hypothetical protein
MVSLWRTATPGTQQSEIHALHSLLEIMSV